MATRKKSGGGGEGAPKVIRAAGEPPITTQIKAPEGVAPIADTLKAVSTPPQWKLDLNAQRQAAKERAAAAALVDDVLGTQTPKVRNGGQAKRQATGGDVPAEKKKATPKKKPSVKKKVDKPKKEDPKAEATSGVKSAKLAESGTKKPESGDFEVVKWPKSGPKFSFDENGDIDPWSVVWPDSKGKGKKVFKYGKDVITKDTPIPKYTNGQDAWEVKADGYVRMNKPPTNLIDGVRYIDGQVISEERLTQERERSASKKKSEAKEKDPKKGPTPEDPKAKTKPTTKKKSEAKPLNAKEKAEQIKITKDAREAKAKFIAAFRSEQEGKNKGFLKRVFLRVGDEFLGKGRSMSAETTKLRDEYYAAEKKRKMLRYESALGFTKNPLVLDKQIEDKINGGVKTFINAAGEEEVDTYGKKLNRKFQAYIEKDLELELSIKKGADEHGKNKYLNAVSEFYSRRNTLEKAAISTFMVTGAAAGLTAAGVFSILGAAGVTAGATAGFAAKRFMVAGAAMLLGTGIAHGSTKEDTKKIKRLSEYISLERKDMDAWGDMDLAREKMRSQDKEVEEKVRKLKRKMVGIGVITGVSAGSVMAGAVDPLLAGPDEATLQAALSKDGVNGPLDISDVVGAIKTPPTGFDWRNIFDSVRLPGFGDGSEDNAAASGELDIPSDVQEQTPEEIARELYRLDPDHAQPEFGGQTTESLAATEAEIASERLDSIEYRIETNDGGIKVAEGLREATAAEYGYDLDSGEPVPDNVPDSARAILEAKNEVQLAIDMGWYNPDGVVEESFMFLDADASAGTESDLVEYNDKGELLLVRDGMEPVVIIDADGNIQTDYITDDNAFNMFDATPKPIAQVPDYQVGTQYGSGDILSETFGETTDYFGETQVSTINPQGYPEFLPAGTNPPAADTYYMDKNGDLHLFKDHGGVDNAPYSKAYTDAHSATGFSYGIADNIVGAQEVIAPTDQASTEQYIPVESNGVDPAQDEYVPPTGPREIPLGTESPVMDTNTVDRWFRPFTEYLDSPSVTSFADVDWSALPGDYFGEVRTNPDNPNMIRFVGESNVSPIIVYEFNPLTSQHEVVVIPMMEGESIDAAKEYKFASEKGFKNPLYKALEFAQRQLK